MKYKIILLVLLFAILSPADSYAKTYSSHKINGFTTHYNFYTHKVRP